MIPTGASGNGKSSTRRPCNPSPFIFLIVRESNSWREGDGGGGERGGAGGGDNHQVRVLGLSGGGGGGQPPLDIEEVVV
jgi:hypothetical protein